jgi:hypothetical protein
MTGSYLEKLRALKSENEAVGALSKLTKPRPSAVVVPDSTTDGGFDSFDSTQGAGFSNFSALYSRTIAALESRRPNLVPVDRWRRAVEDGRRFLARWGEQAEALGWTATDLFSLHKPPAKPHPSYSRLSRYDEIGLIWLLQGRPVVGWARPPPRSRARPAPSPSTAGTTSPRSGRWATAWTTSSRRSGECRMTTDKQASRQI